MNTEVVPCCPICGKEGEPWKKHAYIKDNRLENITTDRCLFCETIYQNPRMTREEMERYYQSGYYNKIYGVAISKERAEWQTTLIEGLRIKPKRVLDVGCGRGYLLWRLNKKFGTEIVGLDYFVDNTLIDSIVGKRGKVVGKFDLITSSHTLEHTYNPHEEIRWMKDRLEPGGYLFFEIPLRHKITLPHTYIFAKKSIDVMMKAAGMKYLYIGQEENCDVIAQREQEAGRFLQDDVFVNSKIEQPGYFG